MTNVILYNNKYKIKKVRQESNYHEGNFVN